MPYLDLLRHRAGIVRDWQTHGAHHPALLDPAGFATLHRPRAGGDHACGRYRAGDTAWYDGATPGW